MNSGLGDMQSKVEPYTNSEKVQQQMQQGSQNPQAHHKVSRNKLVNYLKAYNKPNKVTKSNERSKEIQSYLDGMANDKSVNQSGMYISDDMMKNKDMKQAINQYSDDNGKVVLLNVELDKILILSLRLKH